MSRFKALIILIIAFFYSGYSDASDLECLATNIYFEARGESALGKLAVGMVTLNRVNSQYFPNTVCKVVWQPYQFSWTHDGKPDKPKNKKAYRDCLAIARLLYYNYDSSRDLTQGALHYFNHTIVNPSWAIGTTITNIIGNHVFVVGVSGYKYNRLYL